MNILRVTLAVRRTAALRGYLFSSLILFVVILAGYAQSLMPSCLCEIIKVSDIRAHSFDFHGKALGEGRVFFTAETCRHHRDGKQ